MLKSADISKNKGFLVLKDILIYFVKLQIYVYLSTEFQIPSIILTNFGQGQGGEGNFNPPTSKRTPKAPHPG